MRTSRRAPFVLLVLDGGHHQGGIAEENVRVSPEEAAAAVQRDPLFRAAFRLAYAGPGDAVQALLRHTTGTTSNAVTEDALQAARSAIYRPDASDSDRTRLQQLRTANEVERRAVQDALARLVVSPIQRSPLGVANPFLTSTASAASRRRSTAMAGALAAVLLGALILTWWSDDRPTTGSTSSPTFAPTDFSAAVRLLPASWRGAPITALNQTLDGNTALVAQRSSGPRGLLVVRCPANDRSYQAVIRSAGTRPLILYGACGRQTTNPISVNDSGGGTSVLVTTRGVLPFTAALLQH